MKNLISIVLLLFSTVALAAEKPTLRLYLDADQTHLKAAGQAIHLGIKTALAEVDNQIQGFPIEIVIKDHRGSSPRSKAHLMAFVNDENALAVFTGLHSPPLLAHRQFIHENRILTLNPWAAAGPITRTEHSENWIFRLSVDDTKAGEFITKQAVDVQGFRRPFLVLEDTGWGESNKKNMTQALELRDLSVSGIERFQWQVSENAARIILRNAMKKNADVIFLVANAPEGLAFARAMLSFPLEERLPIRSHWGITGGQFAENLGFDQITQLDLQFIQTRFNFQSTPNERSKKVLQRLIDSNQIKQATDISAVTGFSHAYDLTKLFIAAAAKTELTGVVQTDRNNLRLALEDLDASVQGLIKTYRRPFSGDYLTNVNAHEALSDKDYSLGYFDKQGNILLVAPNENNLN